MGKDDDEKKPPAMRRPRPSETRRHGFGSPEGMEMTDIPSRRPAATEAESTNEEIFDPFQLLSTSPVSPASPTPLEEASRIALTADSTPPSATVASLTSSVARGAGESPAAAGRGEIEDATPTKLRKRRLFFTPSRRKAKPTPPIPEDPRMMTMPSTSSRSDRISGVSPQRTRPTDTPRPTTQFGSGTPRPMSTTSRQQQRSRPGRRRRSTEAPVPSSGLSGYSTPSSRRRQPLGSSSRKKKYNPLEKVSDIFSPRSPDDISPSSSPMQSPNASFDSEYSGASSAGSVKEPFVEQVEHLSRLLATPSQQLGDLALTMDDDDYRSDDDLDDEMEGLESSRRLLAEELSRVDFSLLKEVKAIPESPDRGKPTTVSPSAQRRREEVEEDNDWVPLFATEASHPPNFSPEVQEQENPNTEQSALSPIAIFRTPDSGSSSPGTSRTSTIFEGDEFYSPTSTPVESFEEEDKKPAARYPSILDSKKPSSPGKKKPPPTYSSPDRRKPPPNYPSPDMRKPPPTYPSPDKRKSPAKKSSPVSTPPRPFSGRSDESEASSPENDGNVSIESAEIALGELDELIRSLSGESSPSRDENSIGQQEETRGDDLVPDERKPSQQTKAKSPALASRPPVPAQATTEGAEQQPSTPSKGEEWDPSNEASDDEANSPESLLFDPFGLGPKRGSTMSSIDSMSDFSDARSSSSSTARNEKLIQSFLAFSKRFGDDGRSVSSSVASDLTPNRKMEHSRRILERLNTIFPQSGIESGKSGKGRTRQRKDKAKSTKESTSQEKGDKEDGRGKDATIAQSPSPLDEIIEIPVETTIFGMSILSHDSELDQTISQEQEQTPLLETTLGSEFESSTVRSVTSTVSKNVADSKGSKKLEFEDPPMFIPIFSDDSDDEVVFQKDLPQSRPPPDTGVTPGVKKSKPAKRKPNDEKDKRGQSKRKKYPSGWMQRKSRNWLLALGIFLLITGTGLIVGTTFFPVVETPAPSASPTLSAAPSIITAVPSSSPSTTQLPSFSSSSVPSVGPSANTPMPSALPSDVPSDSPSSSPSAFPSDSPSSSPSYSPSDSPSSSPSNSPSDSPSSSPSDTPSASPSDSPSYSPSTSPSESPSGSFFPSIAPSDSPTLSAAPSASPSDSPSDSPSSSPSYSPSDSPSSSPSDTPSTSPSDSPSDSPSTSPSESPSGSFFPSIAPSESPTVSAAPSAGPSANPSAKPSTSPSVVASDVPSEMPSFVPSTRPSIMASDVPSERPSFAPTNEASGIPTSFPSKTPSAIPSFLPTKMPVVPTSRPTPRPSINGAISFTVSYNIFIFNGLVEFVPQSEYVPELIRSMDLLTDDVLLNINRRTTIASRMIPTQAILPTSIVDVIDTDCPVEVEGSLCQQVIAEITLINAEDSWETFRGTTILAIQIGRLQFHLDRVDENSPVEIIDSDWEPPRRSHDGGHATDVPLRIPTSRPVGERPIRPPISIPISQQRFPTLAPTFSPIQASALEFSGQTPSLLDFLKERSFDGGNALNESSSPQFRAYSWLNENKRMGEYSERQLLQRYSMATLYYATKGDQWLNNASWLSDESECTWFGKTGSKERCNDEGELIYLELDLNNLHGSLPPELGLLSSALETITMSGGPDSVLTGTLPTELGYLTLLKVFVVQHNNLSGTIPSEIGNWQQIEEFDLSRNRFRGELPTQIGRFADLAFFDISNNGFSGSLPSEMGQLEKCRMMFLEENSFDSMFPSEMGNMQNLRTLKAGSNQFNSLPTEIGTLRSADFISFQNCSITGPIATELGSLEQLRQLDLGFNELSGEIPSELGNMGLLQKLDLSHNQLSGPLPTELGSLVNLRGIKLNDNFLSGIIPAELSELSDLTSIHLNSNDFSGTIPSDVCETFSESHPAFHADCVDFEDNCPCCTICCVEDDCECRHLGTVKEYLCFQRTSSFQ